MTKEKLKKCKSEQKKCNNISQICQNGHVFVKSSISKDDIYVLSWIKTILTIKRFLPNIICLVDKHILSMAANSYSGSFIFGDMKNGTYNQVEQIIEMEQRKMSLINVKMLIDEIYGSLDEKYQKFVDLKYFQNKNFPSVALGLEIDERTAYRWNKIILTKLLKFCKLNNYQKSFLKCS